jgi:hypothetical protein
MLKDKNDKEIDLSKYQDPSGLSLKKLSFGLWFSEKRKIINRILIILLISISVFFFSYSIYNYVVYFLNDSVENEPLVTVTSPKNQVADLVIFNPQAFKINGVYDLSAFLKNPNDRFSATFKYCFLIGEEEFLCNTSFILPNEEKLLMAFNKEIDNLNTNVSLEISEIAWRRIDNREIPNWNQFLSERLNFSLRDVNLLASGDHDSSLNDLSFVITNLSPYSYYEVPLNISFYRSENLVGIHRYIITNFMSGEDKIIHLNWVSNLSGVTQTEIQPEINILDESVYLKYQGNR